MYEDVVKRLRAVMSHDPRGDALAAADAIEDLQRWKPISEAPYGYCHPYEDHPEAAEFVLVWNGYHRGVAYCQKDPHTPDDEKQWIGEDGSFDPQPTHYRPLPSPPEEGAAAIAEVLEG